MSKAIINDFFYHFDGCYKPSIYIGGKCDIASMNGRKWYINGDLTISDGEYKWENGD